MNLKRLKGIITTGLLLTMVMGLYGCGNQNTVNGMGGGKQGSETKEKVVRIGCVGQSNTISESGGIAQKLGYLEEELKKEGYVPEVIGFAQAGPAINEAFSAGEIDMAVYGDLPATVCKASGVDTKIFATNNSQCQMCILVQKDSDMQSAADLKKHKVIVARGTIYHQYFKSLIEKEGIKESDLEQINTFSDAASVMSSGNADALITSTSIAYYLESQGIGEVIETTEDHPEWTSQFFAVGSSPYLKDNPNAAKAFIRALIRGQKYAEENPEKVYEILGEITDGYTSDIFEKVYSYDKSFQYFSPEITEESREKLKTMEVFMEKEQLISDSVDMDQFIDTSYYQEVMQEQK